MIRLILAIAVGALCGAILAGLLLDSGPGLGAEAAIGAVAGGLAAAGLAGALGRRPDRAAVDDTAPAPAPAPGPGAVDDR